MVEDGRTDLAAIREMRERIIAQLSDAFSRGDLEMEDFERRLTLAHRTDSLAALERSEAVLADPRALGERLL